MAILVVVPPSPLGFVGAWVSLFVGVLVGIEVGGGDGDLVESTTVGASVALGNGFVVGVLVCCELLGAEVVVAVGAAVACFSVGVLVL